MAFSKIKEVELFNFMSFEHARLVFDDSNILNIKGYNDSGKSAILRGIMVCLADMFKRAQAKYIRYGSEYFRIVVTFEDGISILRDKYMNGQSLYEMYKNGEVIYTTKQGNRLTRVEGVPETIQKYLGLCLTDTGCLNYQSCSDKMLLVETTGSENYHEMHTVLKSEELSRATELINSDRNQLNAKVLEVQRDYEEKNAVLKSRSYVDRKIINFLERKEKESEELERKGTDIRGLNTIIHNLEEIECYPDIEKIDVNRLALLEAAVALLERIEGVEEIPELSKVDTNRVRRISSIVDVLDNLDSLEDIPDVSYVDYDRLKLLDSIVNTLDSIPEINIPDVKVVDSSLAKKVVDLENMSKILSMYAENTNELRELQKEYTEYMEEMKVVQVEAKKEGISFAKCPNCGTFVECKEEMVS